jgi:hypothetical protein
MTDASLEARVWRAVELSANPSVLAQALHSFLPNCCLSVQDDVPTARIRRSTDRIDVEFGTAFLREELADERDFLFVLLHEVYHHVLGHLRIRPGDTLSKKCPEAANLTADMLVNRSVVDRYFREGVPLLSRLYGDRLPGCLLKPQVLPSNTGRKPGSNRARARDRAAFISRLQRAGHSHALAAKAWSVYRLAWQDFPPYELLLEKVVALLSSADMLRFVDVPLLGDHEGDTVDGLPWNDDRFNFLGSDMQESDVAAEPPCGDGGLAAALRRALERDPSRRVVQMTALPGVVCSPGRSDLAFLAAGFPVTLFHGARPLPEDAQGAHVYLYVSNSLTDALPRIYNALTALRDLVATPVHQFSTQVVDCSLDDVARGVRRTTGGTNFTPVLEHALARHHGQIVVITDGIGPNVGPVGDAFTRSGAGLHLVLVDAGYMGRRECPLVPLARSVVHLGRG